MMAVGLCLHFSMPYQDYKFVSIINEISEGYFDKFRYVYKP